MPIYSTAQIYKITVSETNAHTIRRAQTAFDPQIKVSGFGLQVKFQKTQWMGKCFKTLLFCFCFFLLFLWNTYGKSLDLSPSKHWNTELWITLLVVFQIEYFWASCYTFTNLVWPGKTFDNGQLAQFWGAPISHSTNSAGLREENLAPI